MNAKRILACILALLLLIPAGGTYASAAFSDTVNHWAATYIEDMANRGIFQGYEDGTFRPAKELTTGETLALCARLVGLPDAVKTATTTARSDQVKSLIGSRADWLNQAAALCLELGVVTPADLKALGQTGALTGYITKELFSVYLVRTLGLDKLADSLSSYNLPFADTNSIARDYQPYIYLLYAYGVVEGSADNKFEPRTHLNRAVSATMLSRLVRLMEERGVKVELPEYTSYPWKAGAISQVTAAGGGVQLTLTGPEGVQSFSIPSNVPCYLNNMVVEKTAIKTGMYARVCLEDGKPASVRLTPADRLESVTATVTSVTDSLLTVQVGATTRSYVINRFTKVTAGGQTGDRTLLASKGDYVTATLTAEGGTLLDLRLSGGTASFSGILSAVEPGIDCTLVRVTSFQGPERSFLVLPTAAVTVNGAAGILQPGHVGRYVSLQVSKDQEGKVLSAAVDTQTTYLQAKVLGVNLTSMPNGIQATELKTGKTQVYPVASAAVYTYEGRTVALKDIAKGWYFTAKLNAAGQIETLEAYSGAVTIQGEITQIRYGAVTTLTVSDSTGTPYAVALNLTNLPIIRRDGLASGLDGLRVGDKVTVTLQFNQVTSIESRAEKETVTGKIVRIIWELAGTTLELELSDGTTAAYEMPASVRILKDSSTLRPEELKPGYQISLIRTGGRVSAIQVLEAPAGSDSAEISGKVLYVNQAAGTILLRCTERDGTEYVMTVNTSLGTAVISVTGGSLSLPLLKMDDEIVAYGTYKAGEFNATVIIRK